MSSFKSFSPLASFTSSSFIVKFLFLVTSFIGITNGIASNSHDGSQPDIVLILADDMGVNDVPWNSRSANLPALSSLANKGIALDNAYTLPVCTPSRAALMTGIYPFKMGLQRGFGKRSPQGVPTNFTMMPQLLKQAGYSTHGFGKWHLGFCADAYTPLKRGFDTFDGRFVGEEEEEEQEKIQRRSNKQKTESKKKTKNSQEHSSKNKSKRKKQREKKKAKGEKKADQAKEEKDSEESLQEGG